MRHIRARSSSRDLTIIKKLNIMIQYLQNQSSRVLNIFSGKTGNSSFTQVGSVNQLISSINSVLGGTTLELIYECQLNSVLAPVLELKHVLGDPGNPAGQVSCPACTGQGRGQYIRSDGSIGCLACSIPPSTPNPSSALGTYTSAWTIITPEGLPIQSMVASVVSNPTPQYNLGTSIVGTNINLLVFNPVTGLYESTYPIGAVVSVKIWFGTSVEGFV